jgi:hypothetical protein
VEVSIPGPAERHHEIKDVPKTLKEDVPKKIQTRDVPQTSPKPAKIMQTKKMRAEKCCTDKGHFDHF